MTTPETATVPDGGGDAGSVVLGVVLGLLVEASGVILSFLVLYLALRLGMSHSTAVATVVLCLVQLAAWFVAGAVVYEIARQRTAVVVSALVPPLVALGALAFGVVVSRGPVNTHVLWLAPFWLALAVVIYLGGRWWESRIRRARPVE